MKTVPCPSVVCEGGYVTFYSDDSCSEGEDVECVDCHGTGTIEVPERRKMVVTIDVTDAQGLALEAMFRYWNRLASRGCSRNVSFMVDGDGNFKPKCVVEFPDGRPPTTLTDDEVHTLAFQGKDSKHHFDFDAIAWTLNS